MHVTIPEPESHGSEVYFQTPDSNIYYRTTGITRKKDVDTSEKEERKCRLSWLKFALITFVILGGIVGIIILVTQLRDPTPSAETQKLVGTTPTPTFWCIPEVEISLRDRIVINCSLKDVQPKEVTIKVTPPSYYTAGSQPVNLTLTTLDPTSNLAWAMVKQLSSATGVYIFGPLAMCNSSGIYQIQISKNEQILQREEVKLNISSKETQ
ncbi:hypothetical protein CHS0354_029163 [Potamilus streckersoni]|uniref:Uncharacterized protein n=1 Tax=Potamilus streckersoni TaxID=2493646 RepID=A0AAE0T211_9BIVA|nr:hypothetical protein CHS0354_029163 [Potamilus streckersoni]